jgi:crotonobetainyl-CoA:carnitine CoA-transferase CaiB-like acyl-CoA transferase
LFRDRIEERHRHAHRAKLDLDIARWTERYDADELMTMLQEAEIATWPDRPAPDEAGAIGRRPHSQRRPTDKGKFLDKKNRR